MSFRVLVDASTLRSGGGPIIAAHELGMIHCTFGDAVEILLVDGPHGLPLASDVPVRWLPRPSIDPATPTGFLLWSLVEAPRMVSDYKADAYLSFVNWLPLRMPVPAAVYMHSPYAMHVDLRKPRELLTRLPRFALAQIGIATARAVVVQTEMIREDVRTALLRLGPRSGGRQVPVLKVTPTGSWMETKQANAALRARLEAERGKADFWLFYPSIPWTHKNMDGLAIALNLVAAAGIRVGLLLPAGGIHQDQLAPGPHRPLLRSFEGLTQEEMAACYDFVDAVIFPSLLETAGLGLVEALARRRPLLASNREFVHELCGDAAILFDPGSPEDIAAKILAFVQDPHRQASAQQRADHWMEARRDRTETGWRAAFDLLGMKP
jgi:glycosyltransferase involved in cell wall biosynthesis